MSEFLLVLILFGIVIVLGLLTKMIQVLQDAKDCLHEIRDGAPEAKPAPKPQFPPAVLPEAKPVSRPEPPPVVLTEAKPAVPPKPAAALAATLGAAPTEKQIPAHPTLPPRRPFELPRRSENEPEEALPDKAVPAALSLPPPKPEPKPPRVRSEFEIRALELWRKVWSWVIVGEEFRPHNVAIEYSVATAWLVRGAIALILFGIAFFIKYSHDNQLIPPEWRMLIAAGVGAGLVGLGCLLHGKRYQGIGMGLQGAGIVTLYFVGFASYSIYELLPAWVAFGGMGLVTAAAATLAVRQNALLIAVIGSLGGYATPFLVAHAVLPAPVFCGYLLLLAAGLTAIARYREWKILSLIALPGSYLVYGVLAATVNREVQYPWMIAYLSACFVLFSWQTIVYNLRFRQKITLFELLLLIVNFVFYLALAIQLIQDVATNRAASLVPLGTALFFSAEIILFLWWKIQDRILLLLLLVLAALSLALVFPLALSGSWITAAWSFQALAMLYLAIRIRSNALRSLAMVLYFVAGVRILGLDLDAGYVHPAADYWAGMRERFFSVGSYTVALLAGAWFLNLSAKSHLRPGFLAAVDGNDFAAGEFEDRKLGNGFLWFGAILSFLYLWAEFGRFGREFFAPLSPWLQGYLLIGMLGFLFWRQRRARAVEHRAVLAVAAMFFAVIATLYMFFAQIMPFYALRPYELAHSLCRVAEFLPVCVLLTWFGWFSRREARPQAQAGVVVFSILGLGLWFLYSSMELYRAMEVVLPEFRNGAVSVLWGLYAVLLLAVGVKRRVKPLRMTGLVLFAVIAGKIFLIDLAHLPTLYRIIALIIVGLAMLTGAFLYMRFRDTFTEDKKPE